MSLEPIAPTPLIRARQTYTEPAPGSRFQDLTEQQANIDIQSQQQYNIVDDAVEGSLVGFVITVNNPDVTMEVISYGDDQTTPRIVNNFTMEQLLQLGFGLTPGDVDIGEDGRSQDITGTPDAVFPWLQRYKIDTLDDMLGDRNVRITLKFTPALHVHYHRLIVNINNYAQSTINVSNVVVIRRIYFNDDTGTTAPRIGNKGEFSNVDVTLTPAEAEVLRLQEEERRAKLLMNTEYNPPFPEDQLIYNQEVPPQEQIVETDDVQEGEDTDQGTKIVEDESTQ